MITKKDITDAYVFLRTHNNSIPSEVLDFIKNAALEKLEKNQKEYDIGFKHGVEFTGNNTEPI